MYYIKRSDVFNGALIGTHIGYGADFKMSPNLPHGLNEIIVSHNARIGENYTIFHHVTIGEAATMGTPAIVSNIPSPIDAIKSGETALVVNVKDTDSLLQAKKQSQSMDFIVFGQQAEKNCKRTV